MPSHVCSCPSGSVQSLWLTLHSFIEAANSRAPLKCTRQMLSAILTYHQVHHSYLDFIFTFGDKDNPNDAGLALFEFDDASMSGKPKPCIAQIDRSGYEIRHSFLLRAPERLERIDSGPWPWSIRQVAVYHSFDVRSRKSLWITIKGNELFRKRIESDTKSIPLLKADVKTDLVTQWKAALATHMIYFKYAEENWRWVVREMEDLIRKRLSKAKTTPVPSAIPLSTMLDAIPEQDTGLSKGLKLLPHFLVKESRDNNSRPQRRGAFHPGTSKELRKLDVFNYNDLQTLNVTKGHVEELSLVIKLNLETLKSIRRYFELVEDLGLVSSRGDDHLDFETPETEKAAEDEKKEITKATKHFLLRLDRITRSLEAREIQLQSLGRQLDEGNALVSNTFTSSDLDTAEFLP